VASIWERIDWEIVKGLSTFATAFAAVFGIIFGVYNLRKWRHEHVGKKRIDLAEDVLAHFYEVRDAIQSIRSPFGHSGEGSSRKPASNESPNEAHWRTVAHTVFERIDANRDLLNRLHALRYRFIAQIDRNSGEYFDRILMIINRIRIASYALAGIGSRLDSAHFNPQRSESAASALEQHERVIWIMDLDNDPITKELKDTVSQMEQICDRAIRKASRMSK